MIVIERTVDISRPVQTETLRGNEFKLEANAHTFRISVVNNGAAVTLTGSVSASMLLADGSGLTLGGSLDSGVAVLTLPQAAYGVPGRFMLAIYSVQTGATEAETVKTCIYACVGAVINTYGDQQYDPGNLIPDAETLAAYIEACQTATTAANDAAGRAETAALTAVTYAAQSGKTDAEKAQARTNIGAAGETALTAMASLTEYGAILEQQNYSRSGVTVARAGTCSTINGTRDSSEIVRFRMYQAGTTRAGSVPTASQNISGGAQIKAGRTYRLCGRLISGTYTPPETPIYYNDNWRLNAYYAGTTSAWNSRALIRDGVNYVEECTPEADGEICVWLATIPNSTFTDAVLEIWLEDVTDVLRPGTIATQEEPSSSSATYHAGDLLIVGGTLYKATQAIAPGDTIAAGTNVTATSVAEQLAALEARIAALEG